MKNLAAVGLAGVTRSCGPFSLVTSVAGFTENARRWSSRCLPKPSTIGGSLSFSGEAPIRGTLGVAADHCDSQPDEAPQAPPGYPGGLKRPPSLYGHSTWAHRTRSLPDPPSPRRPSPDRPDTLSDTHRPSSNEIRDGAATVRVGNAGAMPSARSMVLLMSRGDARLGAEAGAAAADVALKPPGPSTGAAHPTGSRLRSST
jgi:hypothetical protein